MVEKLESGKVSEEVVTKFSDAYGQFRDVSRVFLNCVKDRLIVRDGVIAIYLSVDDETLDFIRTGLIDLLNGNMLLKLFRNKGDNIHFIAVIGTARSVLSLRDLECKSFSWFTPNMKKFVYFKRR